MARVHFRTGSIFERQGNRALAIEEYGAAYQIDATHTPTLIALGAMYMEDGELDKARRIYRSMLLQNLDPSADISKADVYLYLGEIHERQGERAKAIGMYERGLELDGTHEQLRTAMGRVRSAE